MRHTAFETRFKHNIQIKNRIQTLPPDPTPSSFFLQYTHFSTRNYEMMQPYSKLVLSAVFASFAIASEENLHERKLIVGGEDAPINTYPWFVQIGDKGGVLIAPEFFITKSNYASIVTQENVAKIGALCNGNGNGNCGQDYDVRSISTTFVRDGGDFMLVKLDQRSEITPADIDDGSLVSSYESGELAHASMINMAIAHMLFVHQYRSIDLTLLLSNNWNRERKLMDCWLWCDECSDGFKCRQAAAFGEKVCA